MLGTGQKLNDEQRLDMYKLRKLVFAEGMA